MNRSVIHSVWALFAAVLIGFIPCLTEAAGVRGLEDLPQLDQWTAGFFSTQSRYNPESPPDYEVKIKAAYKISIQNKNFIPAFFDAIIQEKINLGNTPREASNNLARALFEARNIFRIKLHKKELTLKDARRALLLLQILGEETLYSRAYQDQIQEIETPFPRLEFFFNPDEYTANASNCFDQGGARFAPLTPSLPNFILCQGDVIVSKGDAGSSAFLSQMGEIAGNYSHSTVAWIDPNPQIARRLFLPEAFIQDGVKLRDPEIDYGVSEKYRGKKKMAVFRFASNSETDNHRVRTRAIKGVDFFVEQMAKALKLDSVQKLKNPKAPAAFDYDFAMNLDEPAHVKPHFYCSKIAYTAYLSIDPKTDPSYSWENPYPANYRSRLANPIRPLFEKVLGFKGSEFIGPSDVELNPLFKMISLRIDPLRLGQDRVDSAIIDSFFEVLMEKEKELEPFLNSLKNIGNTPVTQKQLDLIKPLLPIALSSKLEIGKSIPPNISAKQLIFFGFLDEKLVPDVRKLVEEFEKNRGDAKKRALGVIELRERVKPSVEAMSTRFIELISNFHKA